MSLICAVGNSGKIATSPDGVTWTSRTSGTVNTLNGVASNADGSLWVAVGANRTVLTSADTITWASRTVAVFGTTETILDVIFANGLFVAVTASGTIATSTDGITWTSRAAVGASLHLVEHNNGLYVALGNSVEYSSTDGLTWTNRTPGPGLNASALGYIAGLWFVPAGSSLFKTATDGITWSSGSNPFGISMSAFATGGATCVGVGGTSAFTSPDGTTWTQRTAGLAGTTVAVCWASAASKFVVVGGAGTTPFAATSPDGITWTTRTIPNATIYNDVAAPGNSPPNAPAQSSPANNATIDRTVVQRAAWVFSDPDSGDSQSAFDLQYRVAGAGSWTTVSLTTPNQFYDFAANSLAAGNYEWQVRTYDAQGVVGPWSVSSFFTAASAPGTPVITVPVSGATIAAATSAVTWSAPSQTDYQVRRVRDNAGSADTATVYYDTGDAFDSATRSVSLHFETNDRFEHIQVRVKANGLWSSWADVRVDVSYSPPPAPAPVVVTADSATASIVVAWTNPAPGGGQVATSSVDVYRSTDGGATSLRVATALPTNSSWTDYTPASGETYSYRVVAVGGSGTTEASAWTA